MAKPAPVLNGKPGKTHQARTPVGCTPMVPAAGPAPVRQPIRAAVALLEQEQRRVLEAALVQPELSATRLVTAAEYAERLERAKGVWYRMQHRLEALPSWPDAETAAVLARTGV